MPNLPDLAPYARQGTSHRKPDDPRSDVEVDRDRIVHSHAFRRLQRKTQIIGVQSQDFFRTRLTHTIECAQLGRALVRRLTDDSWRSVVERREHLADLVEAACLAHDLGHPPFGHTGEEALDDVLRERCGVGFEGNAQSFRIVTLLEPKKYKRLEQPIHRPLGLDLTRATLQAMCKYPWLEDDPRTTEHGGKFGVYLVPDDIEYFDWLWDGDSASAHRTLATDLLEAADDLAYAVHDIEDGIWARMVPVDQIAQGEGWAIEAIARRALHAAGDLFEDAGDVADEVEATFGDLRRNDWARRPFDRSRTSEGGLKSFCSRLTDELVTEVTAGGSLRWNGNRALQRRIAVLKRRA
jgi:dGTPase